MFSGRIARNCHIRYYYLILKLAVVSATIIFFNFHFYKTMIRYAQRIFVLSFVFFFTF